MVRKLFAALLALFIINLTFVPVLGDEFDDSDDMLSGKIVEAEFITDINVNDSSKNQVVEFKTVETLKANNGFVIPRGTILKGRVKARKRSACFYRRAKVRIVINEMILPSGQVYEIKGNTKRRVLKGSAVGNVAKGIVSTPLALVVGAAGTVLMLIETCTIVGVVLLAPTGAIVGGTVGKLTNGVNCTKEKGDDIKIRIIKTPAMVQNEYNAKKYQAQDY